MKSLKLLVLSILLYSSSQAQDVQGAWVRDLDTAIQYMTIVDNYFVVSTFHVDNKKFIRTRGGSYTFKNGQYTEQIEFFTRDASRVGASLSFDAEIKEGDWHHKGKSSQGEPIHEVWKRHHKK